MCCFWEYVKVYITCLYGTEFLLITWYLPVSIYHKTLCLILQTPKATLDIKELRVDISKDGGSEAGLFVKLQLFPITVHLVESRVASDQPVISGGSSSANRLTDGVCPPFSCEEFSLLCELGHNRYAFWLLWNGFTEIIWFISNSGLVLYLE